MARSYNKQIPIYIEQPWRRKGTKFPTFSHYFLHFCSGGNGGVLKRQVNTHCQTIIPAQSQSTVAGGSWAIVFFAYSWKVQAERKVTLVSQSVSRWVSWAQKVGKIWVEKAMNGTRGAHEWRVMVAFRRCSEICISHARR